MRRQEKRTHLAVDLDVGVSQTIGGHDRLLNAESAGVAASKESVQLAARSSNHALKVLESGTDKGKNELASSSLCKDRTQLLT